MFTTTFETATVGDRVWTLERGWGVIQSLDGGETYPVEVGFPDYVPLCYTLGGKRLLTHERQTLFWDEVEIAAPVKPLPDLPVDTKVLVWSDHRRIKVKRHFSRFDKNGCICTFDHGMSSFTTKESTAWPHWELAE